MWDQMCDPSIFFEIGLVEHLHIRNSSIENSEN